MNYNIVILFSWAAFIVVWAVLAFNIKRDIRGGYSRLWSQFWLLRLVAVLFLGFVALRITTGTAHYSNSNPIFSEGLFMTPAFIGWIAAIFSVFGVAFAIWARIHLGRNWSPRPAVKEHHELVTTGPYVYVRHPIYTGLILAAFGSAITGTIFGIIVLVVASLVFIFRTKKEEKIMLELFPDQYPEYKKRTKALIPFVW